MSTAGVIHKRYLPFTEAQLLKHFAPVDASSKADPERHLRHFRQSAAANAAFLESGADRLSQSLKDLRQPFQMEKDERFWIAAALMRIFYADDSRKRWEALLSRAFGPEPPIGGIPSWADCLDGELQLYFEANLPSPPSYKAWLKEHIPDPNVVSYVRDAAKRLDSRLEGATHVDALLLNEHMGFAVMFEAKVASDISVDISFDAMRNQIARNIDVMLEHNSSLGGPLAVRHPDRTLFALVTPRLFKDHPEARLYGWLMRDYRDHVEALARDLKHRDPGELKDVTRRLGWLTWENCEEILPGSCVWLGSRPG